MTARETCRACRKRLSAAAFNGSVQAADGLAGTCRACTNARRRQLDRLGKERRRPPANLAAALRHGDIELLRKLMRAVERETALELGV